MRDVPREPADDDLVFLLCRRTTFEWVLRRTVERECDLRLGTRAEGLVLDERASAPRVVGLGTSGGSLAADLVVDASGRSGGLARRLRAAGVEAPPVSDEPCGIEYTSRFYRLRPGVTPGPLNRIWAAGGVFGGYSCVLFPHDADTLSVGFGRLPSDASLVGVHSQEGFDRAVAAVPFVREWLDPAQAEPLTPPVPMAGIHNMLTEIPDIPGLVGIGDAVCTTDPAFGRGAAIALASGFALARAVDESVDVDALTRHFGAWFADNVVPWHADSVAQDRGRTAMWQAAVASDSPPESTSAGLSCGAGRGVPRWSRSVAVARFRSLRRDAGSAGCPAVPGRRRPGACAQRNGWTPTTGRCAEPPRDGRPGEPSTLTTRLRAGRVIQPEQ